MNTQSISTRIVAHVSKSDFLSEASDEELGTYILMAHKSLVNTINAGRRSNFLPFPTEVDPALLSAVRAEMQSRATLAIQLAQAGAALKAADAARAAAMDLVRAAVDAADRQRMSRSEIAVRLGVARATVYSILKTD